MGWTIWCFTLAPLVRTVVFGAIMQIRHPFLPRLVFRPREVITYVRYGLRTAASQVLYQLYTNLDYAVVLYFFGKRANGIYTLAYFLVLEPVKTIANVVIDVAFPAFVRLRDQRPALVDKLIQLTRLNLITVLLFVILIVLVIPEFLTTFYSGGKWSAADLALCAEAARILCVVGMLRAVGLLGPPLLDGIGHPERTLRYMVVATVIVPVAYVVGAEVLGARLGLLSVAVAWAVGYPIAFLALAYLVARSIDLPLAAYARGAWGIIGCCLTGLAAGAAVSFALPTAAAFVRMVVIGGAALAVTAGMLAGWQKITPRSILASLK
jgi:O-antigen/teichoic acid export membrane protein